MSNKACVTAVTRFAATELAPAKALDIATEFSTAAALDFRRFFVGDNEVSDLLERHVKLLETIAQGFREAYQLHPIPHTPKYTAVPVRTAEGVVMALADHAETEAQKKALREYNENWAPQHAHAGVTQLVAQFLIDGVRSIDEIADMVIFECRGGSREAVAAFLNLFKELGFCKL